MELMVKMQKRGAMAELDPLGTMWALGPLFGSSYPCFRQDQAYYTYFNVPYASEILYSIVII